MRKRVLLKSSDACRKKTARRDLYGGRWATGVPTVTIQLLRKVAERVSPPRALFVPFRHGYPLDTPDDPIRQHNVIEAALRLLEDRNFRPPVLVDFLPAPR